VFVAYQGEYMKGESQIQETKIEGKVEREAKPSENIIQETFEGTQEHRGGEEEGGVLGAIGETIIEIAQQTKELVIGPDRTGTEESGAHKSGSTAYCKQEE
jgi:hypothetical protein